MPSNLLSTSSRRCTAVLAFLLLSMLCVQALSPYLNTSLPWRDRVDDLVSRLSIRDVERQMAFGGRGSRGGPAPGILLLGIKPYSWNTECLAGDVQAGKATSFPQPIGMAATFSPDMVNRVAEAIGIEVRAKYNYYSSHLEFGDHRGTSCFAPMVNVMRDPRWGRSQETYGEDPFLSGELAASYVTGLQGNDPRYIRANAGCKYFDAYAGPENIPSSRFTFDAKVSEIDWRSTYLPAFRRCVTAGTYSLMCGQNSINGVPACANSQLLTDVLRKEWGFQGYVVSDEEAVENMVKQHKYKSTPLDAAVAAVTAGVNLEVSSNERSPAFLQLGLAISEQRLSEDVMRARVKDLFYTRMRLGEFDPAQMNPYSKLGDADVMTPGHIGLSVEAAAASFVLLKNANDTLPLKLSNSVTPMALVGPMGDNPDQMFGSYAVDGDTSRVTTPRAALSKLTSALQYAAGCPDGNPCNQFDDASIRTAVSGAKIVFIALGTGQQMESVDNDRKDIGLPGRQDDVIRSVVKYAEGIPVVLLIFSAGPVDVQWADQHSGISAIMQLFFPAASAGEALRQVLINDQSWSSPAGRLPYTWYLGSFLPFNMTDYSMTGRTYRYLDRKAVQAEVLYPFGYGLSYSKFKYTDLVLPQEEFAGTDIVGSVTVTNLGPYEADEVIQIYLEWLDDTYPHPQAQLVSFTRQHLAVNASFTFKFTVRAREMARYHDNAWFVSAGVLRISAGGQQPYQLRQVPSNILQGDVILSNHANLSN